MSGAADPDVSSSRYSSHMCPFFPVLKDRFWVWRFLIPGIPGIPGARGSPIY